MERGALEEAEGYATESRALLLSEKTPRPALMARNLNNLGRINDLQSKYKNAQGYYLAAIEIFKNRLPSDPQYRETLFNLSESFKMQGDWRSSTQWCEKAAEMGLPAAQFYLGIRLVEGKWIAKNHERAVYWFSQAATAGLPAAQNNLGVMYSQGLGVAQSDSEAVKWYQKAAEQGYASAYLNLAKKIMNGKGTPIDFVKAYYWLSRAAKSDPDDKEADEIRVSLSKRMTKDQMNAALLMLRGDK
jgi:TPR repeat protein